MPVQATLSIVLVAGATMLARSLDKLEHQDFGYCQPVVVSITWPPATYTQPTLEALCLVIEERLDSTSVSMCDVSGELAHCRRLSRRLNSSHARHIRLSHKCAQK